MDAAEALAQTNALLERESVVVFEGAFRSGDFFIRADVVRKSGTLIELFEVKSKSFDPAEEPFLTKNGKGISSTWKPYLYDVAFQKFVMARALPGFTIEAHLMLANKTAVCTVDGLNQMFPLRKEKGRMRATAREGLTSADVCPHVLVKVPVDDVIDLIWAGGFDAASDEQRPPSAKSPSFEDFAQRLADAYKKDQRLEPDLVSAPCKSCQFRCGPAEVAAGLKSGFAECWLPSLQRAGGTEADLDATVLGVWNLHHAKRKAFLSRGLLLQRDLSQQDLAVKPGEGDGFSRSERQWLQVQAAKNSNAQGTIDTDGLAAQMAQWKFPYHFIDFETTMVALPFHKGRRPYEQIAFQFSHHVMQRDGTIAHVDEFLSDTPGVFPNFEFVRALKASLEHDKGTIFRYAAHENSVLCQIYDQLDAMSEAEVPDRAALQGFLKTITNSKGGKRGEWTGDRTMVDLCEVWKKHLYLPATGGSNSIKKVLPAILRENAPSLQMFASPVYGAQGGVASKNFKNWTWLVRSGTDTVDPYKLLPNVFEGFSAEDAEKFDLLCEDELSNGGAAMTAYAMMQFCEMSNAERARVRAALLKYCELDTLAMVMLSLYFTDVTAAAAAAQRAS